MTSASAAGAARKTTVSKAETACSNLGPDLEAVWNTLPTPCVVFDSDNRFARVNGAAELFLGSSAASLRKKRLDDVMPPGSRLLELIEHARRGALSLSEYGMEIDWPGREPVLADVQAAQIFDAPGHVLTTILPRSVAESMDRSLAARGSVRSLSGLSAMLAHEIKNPLAGISGAAQFLEMSLGDSEVEMLRLIQEEVDRIRGLLDRMDVFDSAPSQLEPVNIHDVLDQARRAAAAGFAQHVRFRETYDPSLPPVPGDRGKLLQAISNLIKNAAEAAPRQGAEIILRTAYRPGVKIAVASGGRERLPLEVSVIDNGPGVPDDLRPHIFDPFVTSKSGGSGLGLALVSKIVADHGGVIECSRDRDRTAFRMLLPVWVDNEIVPAQTSNKKRGQGKAKPRGQNIPTSQGKTRK